MWRLKIAVRNANGVASSSPRLRGTSYPGNEINAKPTPTGLWLERHRAATPLGLGRFWIDPQGSRSCFAPTLGWRTKRRWRCSLPQFVPSTIRRGRFRHHSKSHPRERGGDPGEKIGQHKRHAGHCAAGECVREFISAHLAAGETLGNAEDLFLLSSFSRKDHAYFDPG